MNAAQQDFKINNLVETVLCFWKRRVTCLTFFLVFFIQLVVSVSLFSPVLTSNVSLVLFGSIFWHSVSSFGPYLRFYFLGLFFPEGISLFTTSARWLFRFKPTTQRLKNRSRLELRPPGSSGLYHFLCQPRTKICQRKIEAGRHTN